MKKSFYWFFPIGTVISLFLLGLITKNMTVLFAMILMIFVAVWVYGAGKAAGEGIVLSPYSVRPGKRFVIIDSAYSEKANQTYVKVMIGNSYRTLNIHGRISGDAGYIRIRFEGMRYPLPRFEVEYKDAASS